MKHKKELLRGLWVVPGNGLTGAGPGPIESFQGRVGFCSAQESNVRNLSTRKAKALKNLGP